MERTKRTKRKDREDELLALKEAEEIIKDLPSKRQRFIPVDKNQSYIDACAAHQQKCHKKGGFVAGSGQNYDHEYKN